MTPADLSSGASLALPDHPLVHALIAAGRRLEARGMAAATSGNYSAKLPDGRLAMTVSGAHKGRLTPTDLMPVSAAGESLDGRQPSAETLLHTGLYQLYPQVQAILHAHSVISVTLTRALPGQDTLTLEGYEMLKAFPGIKTHETRVDIPVFDNSQDITQLSQAVSARLAGLPAPPPAYLLRGHGIYTWGASVAEAERVMEAMEHLLACELETLKLKTGALR
jgi:methylthioribulose-1-phosphate dehydratase